MGGNTLYGTIILTNQGWYEGKRREEPPERSTRRKLGWHNERSRLCFGENKGTREDAEIAGIKKGLSGCRAELWGVGGGKKIT